MHRCLITLIIRETGLCLVFITFRVTDQTVLANLELWLHLTFRPTFRVSVSVSHVYFHERLHEWDYFKCPNHELETKQTGCYVETKYYCHIKYDGSHFRYDAQEKYNCHQNKKSGKLF